MDIVEAIKNYVYNNLANPIGLGGINPVNQLKPEEVEAFKQWWNDVRAKQSFAQGFNLDANPFNPLHEYDYISAFRAGVYPDQTGHMPSQYKTANNKRAVIDMFGQSYNTR